MEQRKVFMQTKKLRLVVMVCAVLFGLWFMSEEVSAATIRQKKAITKDNPIWYIDYISRTDGNYDMKVFTPLLTNAPYSGWQISQIKGYSITITTTQGTEYWNKDFSFSTKQADNPYDLVDKPIAPGTTFNITVRLYSDEACQTLYLVPGITDYTSAEFTAPAAYNLSTDENSPVVIPLGQNEKVIKGPAGVQTAAYVYYTFTLKEAATITGSISNIGRVFLENQIGHRVKEETDSPAIEWKLSEGTYLLKIIPPDKGEYVLKLKSTPFNWGKCDIQWGSGFPCVVNKQIPFTVTVTGGESGVKIDSITSYDYIAGTYTDTNVETTDTTETTAKGTVEGRSAGDKYITVVLYHNEYGYKRVKCPFSIKPAPPACELSVSTNKAGLTAKTKNTYVEVYKGGKWNTYKPLAYNAHLNITGLKANTKYQYRAYVIENGYKSDYAQETFYTAHKAKPVIKSVKVSKVKSKKVPRRWVNGYWDYGQSRWRSGYYTKPYTNTSYKLTVTLKKNPPKGASTYVVINGKFFRAKGKKYTLTDSYIGKPGKKVKVSVRFARSKVYGAYGKAVSKKVTVRK